MTGNSRRESIEEMNKQLNILQRQLATFSELTKETGHQFEQIKEFGKQQSVYFMSSHSVFQKLNEEKES